MNRITFQAVLTITCAVRKDMSARREVDAGVERPKESMRRGGGAAKRRRGRSGAFGSGTAAMFRASCRLLAGLTRGVPDSVPSSVAAVCFFARIREVFGPDRGQSRTHARNARKTDTLNVNRGDG